MLRFLGWRYVSLLVSSEDLQSVGGAAAFHTVARAARICIGMEVQIPVLVDEYRSNYSDKVIIYLLFTSI